MAITNTNKKESGQARFIGSASAGVLELLGFHPVDTVAKRLMNNKTKDSIKNVVFRDAVNKGLVGKYVSLFPGLGFAAGYKILQRVYKFGGQPFANDFLNKNYQSSFNSLFGEKKAKAMMHATAGSLIGIGEIALLPLDVLKIKMQTNPGALAGRGLFKIIAEEGLGLYKGATWTAARNIPGSFALFGGSAFVKEYVFALEDYSKATFLQNFGGSIAGAVLSISVSAPMDVVKTRIQAAQFDSKDGGWKIVSNMIKQEGFGAFFKGLTPKILVVGPKLIFSFTIAQQLIPIIDTFLKGKK